jgi:phage tail-like protein
MWKDAYGRFGFVSAIAVILVAVVLAVPIQAQAQRSTVAAARFAISIDGVQIGVFTQLTSEADISTGAAAGNVITLSGGRTKGTEMAAWHELVILGDVAAARKSATIIIYDYQGAAVKRYHLENAWPAKLSLEGGERGQLRAATVMLVYEALRVLND